MVCTFAGHREIILPDIREKAFSAIRKMADSNKSLLFLSGGMGEFDILCENAVRRIKTDYPANSIDLQLILPYMSQKINSEREYYLSRYDGILIPSEMSSYHYKAAIKQRNYWMIDHSDFLIAYVHRGYGGAYEALRYAVRKGKHIINLAGTD